METIEKIKSDNSVETKKEHQITKANVMKKKKKNGNERQIV